MGTLNERRRPMLGIQGRWVVAGAVTAALVVSGLIWATQDRGVDVRAGGGAKVPPAPPDRPARPVTTTAPAAVASADRARIVWADAGDIWLYQAATGERRPLTSDGEARAEYLPRFHGPDRVTFVADDDRPANDFRPGAGSRSSVIREVDLSSGRTSDLARIEGGVAALDWSPDGAILALYLSGADDHPSELVFIAGGRQKLIRRFGPVWGRGGFVNYDEWRVEWAPDGRRLLVLDTGLDTSQEETLYVLDADGTDAVAPRGGTWARWGADSQTIYCVCTVRPGDETSTWQALDTGTGARTPLLLERAMRPSVSPDGRFLAFDDGEDTPGVHVLDLTPGSRPRRVAGGAIAPIWLDGEHLAVTDTRPCPDTPDECDAGGHGSMFQPAGTASAIDVASGERTPIAPLSTDNADIAYGAV
jgi:dipeptidyl aminopeptidase/acylaminoacyl peptidase